MGRSLFCVDTSIDKQTQPLALVTDDPPRPAGTPVSVSIP